MMIFDDGTDYKPQTYLDRIKRFAEDKYPRSIIHQDRPSVVLDMQHIRIEMTPGKSCGPEQYKIPLDSSSWQLTTPNPFNQDLIKCNKYNDNRIKPVIRLMKLWNVCKNYRDMASFELESTIVDQLMYEFVSCSTYVDYLLASFEAIRWKTNSNRVKAAIDKIKEAVADEANGYNLVPLDEIEEVFPEL